MELTGRIIKNAEVRNVRNDKKVVSFTVVENNSYKPKNGERVDVPTFFNCSYWISDKIAEHLTKGSVVQLAGHVGVNVYNNMEGKALGYLTYHVNSIKILHKARVEATAALRKPKKGKDEKDDLPF